MRKTIILALAIMALLVCVLAISVSAAPQSFQSYEVELVNGEKLTVYETKCWDQWQGHIHLTDVTYTEPPVDTEGTYATLDWSQVAVVDFTNAWGHRYNSTTGEYDLKVGTNNGYSLHISSSDFTRANATNLKKFISGKATLLCGGCFTTLPALEELVVDNNVKEIAWNAFSGCTALETVTIKEGSKLTAIGQQAFLGCTSLVNINLPDSITHMGDDVFNGCTALTDIYWPKGMTKIPKSTFYNCASLVFEIPDHVTKLGGNAFRNCDSLVRFVVPDRITEIGGFAFAECDNLEEVVITENSLITNKLDGIIMKCPKITSFRIPPLVTEMGYDNFWSCTSLVEVIWPNNLQAITGGNNFNGCTALTSIKIPNTVTTISAGNFSNCSNLSDVYLGASLQSITSGLLNVKSIKRVYIPATVTTIGQNVWGYSNSADTASNITFIFTGTKEQAIALQTYLKDNGNTNHAPNNSKFYDAVLVSASEYDVTQEPSGFHLVYDYALCDAFYEGKHAMTGEAVMQKVNYFKDITFADTCTREGCGYEGIDSSKTIGAIFTYFGYSYTEGAIGGTNSMAQFFGVNEENLQKYEEYMGTTLSFGVIAQANKLEEGQETVSTIKPTIGVDKVLYKDFAGYKHNYFEIKVSGISDALKDTKIVFCAYVIENGKMLYLNNGETVEELTGESYNDVVAIKNAE